MPSRYQINEPHPSTNGAYVHSGIGGAGNVFKAPKNNKPSVARSPASLLDSPLPRPSGKVSTGRGGAGNIHPSSERAVFSFDEELERQSTRERKINEMGAVYHVGRGGAGNRAATYPSRASSRKDSSSSSDSTSSSRSGFFGRLSQTFERR